MTRRRATTDAPAPTAAPLTPATTEPAGRKAAASPRTRARPAKAQAAKGARPAKAIGPLDLDVAILRRLRRLPNEAVDLAPLAAELGAEPFEVQLAVERLHRRRMVVAPFIEPGAAGGAELTEKGLRWLIDHEGGKPKEVPVALKIAKERVRSEDEAARLPRAQVYGVKRT
jgi:hypothetical protein